MKIPSINGRSGFARAAALGGAALVATLALAGCGGGDNQSSGAAAKQVITIWNAGIQTLDDSGEIAKEDLPFWQLVDEFEAAHPGVTVQVNDYSTDDLQKAFTAANLAGKGPDLVALWAGSSTQAYTDYLVDFKEYVEGDQLAQLDSSTLLHAGNDPDAALIGLAYGLPATVVMYYNKAIFAENSISEPTTWEELVSASEKLKAAGVTPMVVGDKDGYNSTWAISALLGGSLGAEGVVSLAPGGSVTMGGAEFTGALTTWKNYITAGYTNPDYLTKSDGDALTSLVAGDAAMVIHGNWATTEVVNMGDNVGVMRVPMPAAAAFPQAIVSQPNINLAVTTYSPVKDLSVELALKIADPEFSRKSQEVFYGDPIQSELINTISPWTESGDNVTGFDSIIANEAAVQFYSLVPTFNAGRVELADFTAKLDAANVAK